MSNNREIEKPHVPITQLVTRRPIDSPAKSQTKSFEYIIKRKAPNTKQLFMATAEYLCSSAKRELSIRHNRVCIRALIFE